MARTTHRRIIAGGLMVVASTIALTACSNSTSSTAVPAPPTTTAPRTSTLADQRRAVDEQHRQAAQTGCKQMLEESLYSPGSARWGNLEIIRAGTNPELDAAAAAAQLIEPRWHVTGYVDAQNKFGALLRLTFHCTATYREENGSAFMTANLVSSESSGDR